jgi:hypothetical protein
MPVKEMLVCSVYVLIGAFAAAFAFSENVQAAAAETAMTTRKRRMTTPVVGFEERAMVTIQAKGAGDD